MVIVGEGSKKVLKLGDKIKVKVKSASKQSGQIDFYFLVVNFKMFLFMLFLLSLQSVL
mgnify:CR=1 FL=1